MKYLIFIIFTYALLADAYAGDVDIYIDGQPYRPSSLTKQDTHTDWYLAVRDRARVNVIESNMRLADCTRARMSYEKSEVSWLTTKIYYCERAANIPPPKPTVRRPAEPVSNIDEYCSDKRNRNDLRCLSIRNK